MQSLQRSGAIPYSWRDMCLTFHYFIDFPHVTCTSTGIPLQVSALRNLWGKGSGSNKNRYGKARYSPPGLGDICCLNNNEDQFLLHPFFYRGQIFGEAQNNFQTAVDRHSASVSCLGAPSYNKLRNRLASPDLPHTTNILDQFEWRKAILS
ncbi:hypothetical protein L873DRAFT_1809361 [Choiromyces venosus 120613-1]|uniref:Uncharacterized protein n=1 Tax=Choiromyces venosus 120613-1 TaxID=1336337 RepID=A0A3N4JHY3_9PEZI|nr:hypothetical protein L873DRAFT_1809361 [Choiromyces venosus 120613-1]